MNTEVRAIIGRVLSIPVEDWVIKWGRPGYNDRRCISAVLPKGTVEVSGRRELGDLVVNAFYWVFGVDVHVKLIAPGAEIEVFYGCHRELGRLVDAVYRCCERAEEERVEKVITDFAEHH